MVFEGRVAFSQDHGRHDETQDETRSVFGARCRLRASPQVWCLAGEMAFGYRSFVAHRAASQIFQVKT